MFDFSYENNVEVLGDAKLQAYLKLMQHIYLKDWAELIQTIVEIEALLLHSGYEKYFNTITLYIFGSRDGVPIEEIKRRLSKEGRIIFMTTADRLIREGKIEGKVEREQEIVKNALQMGLNHKQIMQLTGLSSDKIEKIVEDTDNN